jgi:hypothetical protein
MKLLLALLTFAASPLPAAAALPPPPKPALGMNLSGPADWNTELPFVDVFRFSRPWISQRKGAAWGKGPELALDDRGWVKQLEAECFAETPLCTISGGHYPSGEYTVLYEGEGKLDAAHAAKVASHEPGRLKLSVDASKGGFFLRLLETNPANPVRNIRVLMPGFADAREPWSPAFLDRWRGVACFRFMDWMETNGSKVAQWSDRPRPEDATFARRGIPVEWMIDLCNRQKADAWFCMPHLADDDYVRQFAKLVKERLDPARRIWIEYSNEVWNGQFVQSRYAGEQGVKLGLGPKERPWEAGWHFTARRSVEIFKIWEEVFGGRERLVRVLPSQAANSAVAKGVCDFEDAYRHADALAIAPYISLILGPKSNPTADEVAAWSVAQVLDHVEKVSLPESLNWIQQNKAVADARGLKLVCYEAGQHLVGILGAENNEALTKLLHSANAHPRMGGIYKRYYEAWAREGGDLLCHFSSIGGWSKWGSWGLLEHADDDAAKSPKFRTTIEWARALGQPMKE